VANRLSTIVAAFETAANTLVPATLKAVQRGPINPFTEVDRQAPSLGIYVSRAGWDGGPADDPAQGAVVILELVTQQATGDLDETILDLVAEIENVILAAMAANSGLGGGAVRSFDVEPWYHVDTTHPLVPVGAVMRCRISFDGKLKTAV